jgi:hypothetical protein
VGRGGPAKNAETRAETLGSEEGLKEKVSSDHRGIETESGEGE